MHRPKCSACNADLTHAETHSSNLNYWSVNNVVQFRPNTHTVGEIYAKYNMYSKQGHCDLTYAVVIWIDASSFPQL